MSNPLSWWPLKWSREEEMQTYRRPYGRNSKTITAPTGRFRNEATVKLPNGKCFSVVDLTEQGKDIELFTVDAFGVNSHEPTQRVPDMLALRCFLAAEAEG